MLAAFKLLRLIRLEVGRVPQLEAFLDLLPEGFIRLARCLILYLDALRGLKLEWLEDSESLLLQALDLQLVLSLPHFLPNFLLSFTTNALECALDVACH